MSDGKMNVEDLRDFEFTAEDLKEIMDEDIDIEGIAEEIEAETDLPEYKLTLYGARKETKEIVREEIAKFKALQKMFGSTKPAKYVKGDDATSLCIIFSDWHFGKIIKQDGEFVYNSQIAYERITQEMIPQIMQCYAKLNKTDVVDEIRIFMLGDHMENDIIYENQRFHIDQPVSALYMALDTALSYSKIKNIEVRYGYGASKIVDVKGHKGLLRHWAPAQSETPSAKSKFGGWSEIYQYDFLCYGHYHNWGVNTYHGKPIFRNGSLCGTDSYAKDLALSCEWGQLMWGVTKENVMTFLQRIK
jgi:predicted phosphodiesterase